MSGWAALGDARTEASCDLDVPFYAGGRICNAEGRKSVEAVAVRLGERVEKVQADMRGPVAAALLDFLYTGMMSTLNVGCVRYGLMLRENGPVVDDGTCARRGAGFSF